MKQNIFSPMEIDAIGEIMNISLGSSATAVSNMLDHRVDITTPSVSVVPIEEFTLGELEPAIGIEIKYVSGLEGSNIMLLKRHDVKTIVEILMGTEISDEEFEFNDLTISAVCEVMNQMMGAASTALSDFLGRSVNISTPQSFTLDDLDQFEREHFQYDSGMVVVAKFMLSIENVLKSEFVNVMSVDLARELIAGFGVDLSDGEGKGAKSEEEVKPEHSNWRIRHFLQTYKLPELEQWFDELLDAWFIWAEFQYQWQKARDASMQHLEFPFPYRKGQRELVSGVYRTILRKKELFVQASLPSGCVSVAHCRYGTGSTRTASGQRRGCRTAPLLRGRRCGCSKCFNRRALRRSVRESRHRPPGEPSDDLCVPAHRRRPESAEPPAAVPARFPSFRGHSAGERRLFCTRRRSRTVAAQL